MPGPMEEYRQPSWDVLDAIADHLQAVTQGYFGITAAAELAQQIAKILSEKEEATLDLLGYEPDEDAFRDGKYTYGDYSIEYSDKEWLERMRSDPKVRLWGKKR